MARIGTHRTVTRGTRQWPGSREEAAMFLVLLLVTVAVGLEWLELSCRPILRDPA